MLQTQAELHITAGLAGSQWDYLHRKALVGVTTQNSGPQGVVITALTACDLMWGRDTMFKKGGRGQFVLLHVKKAGGGGKSLLEMVKIVF